MVHDLKVLDPETMQEVPEDGKTTGEVMIKGNMVMKGYFKNPSATEEAFAGGWFHSGDLAVRHPNGRFQIKDRSKGNYLPAMGNCIPTCILHTSGLLHTYVHRQCIHSSS